MGQFYTYFGSTWDSILISGYEDGIKFNHKVPYSPFLFVSGEGDTEYKSYDGKPLEKLDFETIREARRFLDKYKEVANFSIHGLTDFPYVYAYENFRDQVPDTSILKIFNFDIETDSEHGYGSFGSTGRADREIISITIKLFGEKTIYVLGRKPYETKEPELLKLIEQGYVIKYKKCDSEYQLLRLFLEIWKNLKPDVVVGWNIEGYDIPFIIQRIVEVIGENHAKKLSPFGIINTKDYIMYGRTQTRYTIAGVPIIDSMRLYEKMYMGKEESYSLAYISKKILGASKLDYSEYKSLANLYKQNHNKFIDYNIIDVLRVEQVDQYTGYMSLLFTMAYFALVNYSDIFGTIKVWDTMIHNYLLDRKIAVKGNSTFGSKTGQIAGGFVKNVQVGRHDAVMSFDFTSLYPHLTMMSNISPDTMAGFHEHINKLPVDSGDSKIPEPVQEIMNGGLDSAYESMVKRNVTISGKGVVFSKDKVGFIPAIMKDLFNQRKVFSKKESENEELLAEIEAEMHRRGMKKVGDEWI